ncbi:MAG TPA: thioredoxin-disulfide reductase [Candidatus Saccharimonadales bacterium]|nr:thioredoxin-disulfide reductase [Candidatus Saccharimonadales bacterium]
MTEEAKSNEIYDVIVAGSGPAGTTAAIYSARSNLKTLVVAGVEAGGQLIWTTDVEDYPGFPDGVQGPDLVALFRKQAEKLGAVFTDGDITEADLAKRPFQLKVGSKDFVGKSLILATGASAKWLGLPSEQKLRGRGVSACAVCDGAFFKGKNLVVVGGGDTALKDALFLTKFAPKVYVVHRRDSLRAFKALQDRVKMNKQIEFIWDSELIEVLGEDRVEGAKIKNIKTEKESTLPVEGVFIAIGHKPNTEFLKGQLELDKTGYITLKGGSTTSVEGVFAAGDVHDYKYQQAVTAAGAGAMAALEVEDYLEEEKARVSQT